MSTDNLFEDIEQDNNPSFYGNPSILNDPYRPIQPPPPQQQQQQHQEMKVNNHILNHPNRHSNQYILVLQMHIPNCNHNININIILCSIMVILMNWSTVLLDYPIEFLNY